MNDIPSSEFRKQFARLTAPTTVSVHGHVIGTWMPRTSEGVAIPAEFPVTLSPAGFNSRPFTPVPKTRGK